jgi:hypothetical protein
MRAIKIMLSMKQFKKSMKFYQANSLSIKFEQKLKEGSSFFFLQRLPFFFETKESNQMKKKKKKKSKYLLSDSHKVNQILQS